MRNHPSHSPLPDLSKEEIARYARHLILEEVGLEGQRRLKAASVLCVGSGGLGSPLLLYLAAAGVGRIGICDFDRVDASNLQRQIIHGTGSVGRRKVESARERLYDVNPHVQVDLYEEPLTSANALEILAPYDVVVDGTDNFPTRYLVNDACLLLDKPNVYGSIFKFEGQASVFNYQDGPNYRDLYPQPPPPGAVPSCAEGGVLGILPGVIGCIQATETLKILLGRGTTLSGRLLLYDALQMRFRELRLRKQPDTPKVTELIDYQQFCGVAPLQEQPARHPRFTPLSVSDVRARIDAGWQPFFLDVRTAPEARLSQLPRCDLLVPHTQVSQATAQLPRDRDIVVYCKVGVRSAQACGTLADLGFARLFNMEGGINAWAEQIDPSLPRY